MIVTYHSRKLRIAFTWDRENKRWLCHGDDSPAQTTGSVAASFIGSKWIDGRPPTRRNREWRLMVFPSKSDDAFMSEVMARLAYESYYGEGC